MTGGIWIGRWINHQLVSPVAIVGPESEFHQILGMLQDIE
jgi:hypothetical protein